MDWLIGVLLLVVGLVIGFFVAKYVYDGKAASSQATQKEQTLRDIMVQQSQVHIDDTRKIAEQFEQYSRALNDKLDVYEKQLNKKNSDPQGVNFNYFGEHTTAFLQGKNIKIPRDKVTSDVQPLDFSDQGSGLFNGTEKTAKEQQAKS
ncbi:MAG: uncharacterized membrane-anchored protein YhcB (DUF1043 family) [Paraglaciecola sp.]|jgi:uncharacterized membrane-anchored protein YhcB (DUF1043 family)